MSTDPTEAQGGQQRRRSQQMSLERGQPPTQVPGYDPERFLGMGAYGEVWVARERNTGRRVAIKFYAHRGGLDWSLLSREVEKLAFLFADRYVVQLLGVGWEAEPPYYIMEYLERGSLAERLLKGPMPLAEAVQVFRDVAVGLIHSHSKGVLHCDLKPANILLDQDGKPRLADFGQSRLSHEQMPALGTLFYMAPEQADLEATPDARWDVYAVGALLYCMLTGGPPHRTGKTVEEFDRTPQLPKRLSRYRKLIEQSPPPRLHRRMRGVDRPLSEIIDRCLAADPEQRFPNMQAVLDALDRRDARRKRRPMMILGVLGPALLLAVVGFFAWRGFNEAIRQSDQALTARALLSNRFAAKFAARAAANQLDDRCRAVQLAAASAELTAALAEFVDRPEMAKRLDRLADPAFDAADAPQGAELRTEFQRLPERVPLQEALARAIPENMRLPKVTGWFLTDRRGVQVARIPEKPDPGQPGFFPSLGKCGAWRSYFHGEPNDRPRIERPQQHITKTTVSAVFRSQATDHWMVSVSQPIWRDGGESDFLGVVALMVDLGRFVELQENGVRPREQLSHFAVLVDWRKDRRNRGVVLQHPLLRELPATRSKPPASVETKEYHVLPEDLPAYALPEDFPPQMLPPRPPHGTTAREPYRDPLDVERTDGGPPRDWLVQCELIAVNGDQPGWAVIVQEDHQTAIGSTLAQLRASLARYVLMALAAIGLVVASLWSFVIRTDKGE